VKNRIFVSKNVFDQNKKFQISGKFDKFVENFENCLLPHWKISEIVYLRKISIHCFVHIGNLRVISKYGYLTPNRRFWQKIISRNPLPACAEFWVALRLKNQFINYIDAVFRWNIFTPLFTPKFWFFRPKSLLFAPIFLIF